LNRRAKRLDNWAKKAEPRQLIALRAKNLISRLNTEKINKKKRKQITSELWGYGIIPLRKSFIREVIVRTDDDLFYDHFEIEGVFETTDGDNIIGYYCPKCMLASNIKRWQELLVKDPSSGLTECLSCGCYGIKEIHEHNIIGQA